VARMKALAKCFALGLTEDESRPHPHAARPRRRRPSSSPRPSLGRLVRSQAGRPWAQVGGERGVPSNRDWPKLATVAAICDLVCSTGSSRSGIPGESPGRPGPAPTAGFSMLQMIEGDRQDELQAENPPIVRLGRPRRRCGTIRAGEGPLPPGRRTLTGTIPLRTGATPPSGGRPAGTRPGSRFPWSISCRDRRLSRRANVYRRLEAAALRAGGPAPGAGSRPDPDHGCRRIAT